MKTETEKNRAVIDDVIRRLKKAKISAFICAQINQEKFATYNTITDRVKATQALLYFFTCIANANNTSIKEVAQSFARVAKNFEKYFPELKQEYEKDFLESQKEYQNEQN